MPESQQSRTTRAPRLAVNYVILSGGEFIAKLAGFIAFAYLARVLGPQYYGYLEFATAVIFFFTLVVDSGLGQYGAREIAKNIGAVKRLASHIMFVRLLLAAGASALVFLFASVIDVQPQVKQLLILYGLTLFGLPGLLQWVFQGLDRMHYVAIASILRWSIFAAGALLLVDGPEQLWMVPVVEGCAIGIIVIFYILSVTRSFGSIWQPIDRFFAFSTWRQALPIGASDIVWAIEVYFAVVLLGLLLAGPEVGWFAAAHRIVISLHTFVWLYFFNLLASLSRCTQGPLEDLQRLVSKSLQVTAWVAVFIGIVGTVLAESLMSLVYGEQYHEAAAIFQVLIWIVPLAVLEGHYRNTLIAYGKQRLLFVSTVGGAGLAVILNLLLVPAFGSMGGAWALVAATALTVILTYLFVRHTIVNVPFWPHLYRPLLAGAILLMALVLLPTSSLFLAGAIAAVLYSLLMLALQPQILADARSVLIRD